MLIISIIIEDLLFSIHYTFIISYNQPIKVGITHLLLQMEKSGYRKNLNGLPLVNGLSEGLKLGLSNQTLLPFINNIDLQCLPLQGKAANLSQVPGSLTPTLNSQSPSVTPQLRPVLFQSLT